LTRGLRAAAGGARLVVAAAIIGVVAYALSWQILRGGMVGSEAPFHLHLIDWVATTFPNLPSWYPWDGMGVSYRDAYPLASHWIAVAIARVLSVNLEGGAQVVQFAMMPLTALGLYFFFDWRLKRPIAGVAAAVLFLLSPIGWVEWTHFGLYASWVGMVLFMPCLIALDAFFSAWVAGDRGLTFRVAGISFVVLTTALGVVSPHLLAAPLIAAFAYALASPRASAGRAWRWLFVMAPLLSAGVLLLSAFWLGAELQYLAVVRSHWTGAGTNFDLGRLTPIDLGALLSLSPMRDGNLGDLYSFTPAALLPAILGVTLVVKDGRARVLVGLSLLGIAFMTFRDLYRPLFAVPGFSEFAVVAHRPLLLIAGVGVPALAALGLFELPRVVGGLAARRWRWPGGLRLGLGVALQILMVVVLAADVSGFAGRIEPSGLLAYGPSVYGATKLSDLGHVPALAVACQLGCPANHQALAKVGSTFPSPPQRAELNSGVAQLDMAFHTLVGGGITHSYNDQVIPSRELASWMEQSMLVDSGTTTKTELAAALGVDAVVLSPSQASRASDYTQMGWQKVSSSPIAFVNPDPTGLAAQWSSGNAVLVVGKTQASVPALYNFVFERATTGALPFASAWLVRGASPNIDDYTDADLSRYAGVILLGYQYHDQGAAWTRLDRYVKTGGHLFVETGWQYVDPDWDAGTAPSVLPVASLRWSALDPLAPVQVDGATDQHFGPFTYGSGGWGASSAPSVRQGATELVRVGDRVVAARWDVGRGRVLWSGMNLMAHDATSGSADEGRFLADQLGWLFAPPAGATSQVSLQPSWNGSDQVSLALEPSTGPSLVLLKESLFPGWTARLVTPNGSSSVDLVGSEMDFMLANLGSVPQGSTLVFTYGPTIAVYLSWALSVVSLVMMLTWALLPRWFRRLTSPGARLLAGMRDRASARFNWSDDDG
jgi:hypothetical protein